MKKPFIKSVLFDLDGTLLDTAGDLGHALNRVLQSRNIAPVPLSQLRSFAGRGCKGLLKIGMNIDENHPEYAALCEELLDYYHQHIIDSTQLFPGMAEVLTHLDAAGISWGIVTNKPQRFTQRLVEHLNIHQRTQCIISGDTLKNCKPHPEPVLHACRLLQQKPENCLYVGDAEVDVIASKAAGTAVLVALYGYIPAGEFPEKWNADGYINHPLEIISWI